MKRVIYHIIHNVKSLWYTYIIMKHIEIAPSSDRALRHSARDVLSSPDDNFNAFIKILQPLFSIKLAIPSSK